MKTLALALLLTGCAFPTAQRIDGCEPPPFDFERDDCNGGTPGRQVGGSPFVICRPGDGTYWLFLDGEVVHQDMGKTDAEQVICRGAA